MSSKDGSAAKNPNLEGSLSLVLAAYSLTCLDTPMLVLRSKANMIGKERMAVLAPTLSIYSLLFSGDHGGNREPAAWGFCNGIRDERSCQVSICPQRVGAQPAFHGL